MKKSLIYMVLAFWAVILGSAAVQAERAGRFRNRRGLGLRRNPIVMKRLAGKSRRSLIRCRTHLRAQKDNEKFEQLRKTLHDGVKYQIIAQAIRLRPRRGVRHKVQLKHPDAVAAALFLKARANAREVLKELGVKIDKDQQAEKDEKALAKGASEEEVDKAVEEYSRLLKGRFPAIEDFLEKNDLGLGRGK